MQSTYHLLVSGDFEQLDPGGNSPFVDAAAPWRRQPPRDHFQDRVAQRLLARKITPPANPHKLLRNPKANGKKGLTDRRLLCHNFYTQPQEV
jgi:hypothetical protein